MTETGWRTRVRPAADVDLDDSFDVIVVGAGAAGFPAAIGAARAGARVLLLEKADAPGGSFAKSLGGFWIPDNAGMRGGGVREDREATLRFLARCARPAGHDPRDPHLGLEPWEHELLGAYFDHAAAVVGELEETGAITPGYLPDSPDYQTRVPENRVGKGRTMVMLSADGRENLGGHGQTQRFVESCAALGVELRCGREVEAVVVEDGRVVGVLARTGEREERIGARGGVIFASGGFAHARDLCRAFLPGSVIGTAAAPGVEGNFVRIATELGLPLHGMQYPWLAPLPLELALADDPGISNVFVSPGDSMLYLNRYGRRVVNEKAPYHEVGLAMGRWDPLRLEYPDLLLFMLFDERVHRLWAPPGGWSDAQVASRWALDTMGNYAYDGPQLIRGETLEDLVAALAARLAALASQTGGLQLDPGFSVAARAQIERFNALARSGRDADLARGETPIEQVFFGERRPGNELPNPLMYPLSDRGPYFAVILSAGTLDTRGGPRTDAHGRVIGPAGDPLPGLYGAGNCVASMFGQGYPGGGATIGPAMVFGWRAGEHAARRASA